MALIHYYVLRHVPNAVLWHLHLNHWLNFLFDTDSMLIVFPMCPNCFSFCITKNVVVGFDAFGFMLSIITIVNLPPLLLSQDWFLCSSSALLSFIFVFLLAPIILVEKMLWLWYDMTFYLVGESCGRKCQCSRICWGSCICWCNGDRLQRRN